LTVRTWYVFRARAASPAIARQGERIAARWRHSRIPAPHLLAPRSSQPPIALRRPHGGCAGRLAAADASHQAATKGLERRPVEFFEQLPARIPEPAQRLFLIEPPGQLGNRRIEFGEAIELVVAVVPKSSLPSQHKSG